MADEPPAPRREASSVVRGMLRAEVFEEVEKTADLAMSYCHSIGEAAYRHEALTVGVHLKQLRACVMWMIKLYKEGDIVDGQGMAEAREESRDSADHGPGDAVA